MGWFVLSHPIEKMVRGERFVGIEDEMAVVVEGGGVFDPKIAIRDAVVAPTGKGKSGSISVEN